MLVVDSDHGHRSRTSSTIEVSCDVADIDTVCPALMMKTLDGGCGGMVTVRSFLLSKSQARDLTI